MNDPIFTIIFFNCFSCFEHCVVAPATVLSTIESRHIDSVNNETREQAARELSQQYRT